MTLTRRFTAAWASAAVAALALSSPQEPEPEPDTASVDARAIYLEHCASCHGESGDGQGNEELERPARSFLDGGYSYGNTQAAVLRSVVHGIPGTPMPAFGETLGAAQLTAVADYVISLGPPGTIVEPGETVMEVGEKPVVVQGMVSGRRRGGTREPRSLLVGFPNGTTFHYRQTDGRLLSVRQGDFLDRRDWGGRGGQSLRPLGQTVWRANGALENGSEFVHASTGTPLRRSVVRSRIEGQTVWLDFDLVDVDGKVCGGGQEILDFLMVEDVPVPVRSVVAASATNEVEMRGWEGAGTPLVLDFGGADDAAGAAQSFHAAAEGVFAVDPVGTKNARIYIHTESWGNHLGTAVLESLGEQN